MAMSAKDKRMADMKRRFQRTSPSGRLQTMKGQTISQRLRNLAFGKTKKMGPEDDVLGIATATKPKKDKKTSKTLGKSPQALGGKLPTKGKVDVGLSQALKNQKKKNTTKTKTKTNQTKTNQTKTNQTKTKTGKVKATEANTKNYASTLALQKRLKKLGAKIDADGIMGPKTRAAIKKYIKNPSTLKKNKSKVKVMVDSESYKPKNPRGPKVTVRQGTPDQKRGTKVQKAPKDKSFLDRFKSDFDKAVKETKRNFSGDFKKKTGRYKLVSTGKTNFNKKKNKK